MDLTHLEPLQATQSRWSVKNKGQITMVLSKRNGIRLELREGLVAELHLEDTVQIALLKKSIVIAKRLPGIPQCFDLKSVGRKSIIYSSDLVREIAEKLSLDFSDRVSITLTGIELGVQDDVTIARIWIEGKGGDKH